MLKILPLCLLAFSLISCHTITYVNNKEYPPGSYEQTRWHHNGFWGVAEFSLPVNVKAACGEKGWRAVRTRKSLSNILVNSALQSIPVFHYSESMNNPASWEEFMKDYAFMNLFVFLLQPFLLFYSSQEAAIACGPPPRPSS